MSDESISTWDFRFLPGDVLPASPAEAAGYTTNFGSVKKGNPMPEFDIKERFKTHNRAKVLGKIKTANRKLSYEFEYDELSDELLVQLFGAAGDAPQIGKVVEGYGWAEASGEDVENDPYFLHHSFRCGIVLDNAWEGDGEEYDSLTLKVFCYLDKPGVWTNVYTPPV